MVFKNGVKNIQAAAYNGARTVYILYIYIQLQKNIFIPTAFIFHFSWNVRVKLAVKNQRKKS